MGCYVIRLCLLVVLPWLFSLIFLFSFPIKAAYQNIELFLLSTGVFLLITVLVGMLVYIILSFGKTEHHYVLEPCDYRFVNFNYRFLLLAVFLGILFLVYDRLVLRGIDYFSLDIRAARYAWLASEGGGGFGIVGNLLIPFSYVGIYFSIKFVGNEKKKVFLVAASLAGIMVHSFLNGGRSNIFLLIVLLLSVYAMSNFRLFRFFLGRPKIFVTMGLMFLGLVYYVFLVVSSSASIGNVDLKEIFRLGALELYGEPESTFFAASYSDFIYLVLYSLMYIFHGQWTHQAFFGLSYYDAVGFHFLAFAPTVFLDGLGIVDLGLENRAFSDTGAFITLVGAVLYDFGWFGLVVFSICVGCLFGYCLYLKKIRRRRYGFMSFFILLNTLPLLLLAPVLSVYGFAYFSFINFAFFAYWLLNFFVFRKSKIL